MAEMQMALQSLKAGAVGGSSGYVLLNVGGTLFSTTAVTLKKQGSHMLSAMFSGRMEIPYDQDGWVTIDRDGRLFSYILNFLRDGHVTLPEAEVDKLALLTEAKYYLLDGLIRLIETHSQPPEVEYVPVCVVPTLTSDREERMLVQSSAVSSRGWPVVIFAYNRSNNKFSYTSPSDDALLKNIELFDKLSEKFNGRVLYVKDTRGKGDHICTWFFYGHGHLQAEVCCTAMVYSAERKLIKIEFPEARLYEENMSILLFEPTGPPASPNDAARRQDGPITTEID